MWELESIAEGPFPKIKGQYKGEVLIVGSAACVWDDLARFKRDCDVMCVNDMGMYYPGRVRHWYSNDHHMLARWKHCRRPDLVKRFGRGWLTHSNYVGREYPDGPIDYWWPIPGQGTSGLTAAVVGRAMGYDAAVLAGVPLDHTGHFFEGPQATGKIDRESPPETLEAKGRFLMGFVKSLSGRTRDYFGAP